MKYTLQNILLYNYRVDRDEHLKMNEKITICGIVETFAIIFLEKFFLIQCMNIFSST